MTTIVNVKTRQQFDGLLHDLHMASILAVDTETEGLNLHNDDYIIGISFYFPDVDRAYYYGFGHGMKTLSDDVVAPDVRKSTTRYKLWNTEHLYTMYERDDVMRDNAPDWLDELRKAWETPRTVVMFNAQFDLTALAIAVFPAPHKVYDVRVGAQALFSDWNAVQFKLPDGSREWGSRSLKWLARYFAVEGAKEGVDDLSKNMELLRKRLYAYSTDNIPVNDIQTFLNAIDNMNNVGDPRFEAKVKGVLQLNDREHLWMLKASEVAPYAAYDTILTYRLHETLLERLYVWNNVELYERMSETEYRAAWTMHMEGFKVDVDEARKAAQHGHETLERLEREAQTLTGIGTFNIGSPKQVLDYLRAIGYKETSANKDVIAKLKDDVPLLALVDEYRGVQKLIRTYLEKWIDNADENGIVHPTFGYNTKTGRWASDFQQVPSEVNTEYAPKNVLYGTRNGYTLFEADYSSLEMRVGAWVCEHLTCPDLDDTTLTDLIVNDVDMHAYTRDKANVPTALLHGQEVTPENVRSYYAEKHVDVNDLDDDALLDKFMHDARKVAKITNFLAMYGGTGLALTRVLPLKRSVADEIVNGWKVSYPAIVEAMKRLERQALQLQTMPDGTNKSRFITYPIERLNFTRKYNPYPTSFKTKTGAIVDVRKIEARNAMNSVIQGTSGLLCTEAARRIALEVPEAVLHASVHDSIVFSLKPSDFNRLIVIRDIMTDYPVYPPLKVDFEYSTGAWGEKRGIEDLEQFIKEGANV